VKRQAGRIRRRAGWATGGSAKRAAPKGKLLGQKGLAQNGRPMEG
jgi:hypothetical protein